MRGWVALLIVFCLLQGMVWRMSHARLPDMDIVPEVPGESALHALALGDGQSFFRLLALRLQNAGDSYGRFTPLKDYDYRKLGLWFGLLDTLDAQSDYIPAMASFYYAQTQRTQDVRIMVDYLVAHAEGRESRKWWWLVQAVYLANHKLKDKDLALAIARRLEGRRDIPIWAQQMPAFIHEQRGEFEDAYRIITEIERKAKDLSPAELTFMRYFVEERLQKLEKAE